MSLEFTLVRRAISLAVIDGPDAGDNPDILQAQGSVLFEPVIKKGDSIQVQTRGGSETYALAPIECPINDGIISHRGQDGVKLPAGGEAANPSLIRWKATFSRMQAGGKSFTLAPVIFDAVPGGEIDLTMVAPVAGAPEGVVRGPRGTSLESIIVDGSELVFTAVDDAGSFEIARIPLDEMVRAEAEAAADGVRDALAVDVAASQASRDAAEGHADRAAMSESNAKTSETNAKQSEDTAGDYAAVATTAATEAVDAMEVASGAASSIGDSVNAAAGHADRAEQSESSAATHAQNASAAADRVGTAEQIGDWAQQASDSALTAIDARDTAVAAADDAQITFSSLFGQDGKLEETLLPDRVDMKIKSSQSTASLGSELVTSSGWTLGSGWSGSPGSGFTASSGAGSLEWGNALPAGSYQVAFQLSTQVRDIQNLDVTLGDSDAPYIYGLGTNIVTSVKVTSPGALRFTPVSSPAWTGTITNISVREIQGTVPASLTILDDSGTDAVRVRVGEASQQNFYVGDVAGRKNTSGVYNVAIGAESMGENTSGYWNTSVGWQAMLNNTSGTRNVALGMRALTRNTTGYRNVALGQSAMVDNTTGQGNIAIGADSMIHNISGTRNIAIGLTSLGSNRTGERNIAIGNSAMNAALSDSNVGVGDFALYASESAGNVAVGAQAARYTKAGGATAVGYSAGTNVVSGADNTTIGYEAGRGRGFGSANYNRVTAVGKNAGRRLGTGHDDNTLIGYAALANADGGVDNTVIGMNAGLSAVGDVVNRNVLIGKRAGAALKTGGDENTLVGTQAGNALTTGASNVLIGYNVQASSPTASNEINIGNVIKGSNVPGYFEVSIEGKLRVANIPKQDPQSAGQVWNDNGTLKVSAG